MGIYWADWNVVMTDDGRMGVGRRGRHPGRRRSRTRSSGSPRTGTSCSAGCRTWCCCSTISTTYRGRRENRGCRAALRRPAVLAAEPCGGPARGLRATAPGRIPDPHLRGRRRARRWPAAPGSRDPPMSPTASGTCPTHSPSASAAARCKSTRPSTDCSSAASQAACSAAFRRPWPSDRHGPETITGRPRVIGVDVCPCVPSSTIRSGCSSCCSSRVPILSWSTWPTYAPGWLWAASI